jgi:DNA-binding NarL/FixJ family response regulator
MSPPIQVVVVDDHEIVRLGLRAMLDREDDINVIGTAADGHQGLDVIGQLQPDVAVIDYSLPGMSGVELCGEVRKRWDDIRVVMLTTFLDEFVIRSSLLAGAQAYVYKDVEGLDLKRAIRTVANGQSVLDPNVTGFVIRWASSGAGDLVSLSGREVDILRLVVRGRSNQQIADELHVSINTVKTCLGRVYRKLDCHNRSQAASLAASRGFL